ncbi:MAG: 30S ribosomal protein S20 [Bacteroidia bacterium]|nr:30S ribosomal protein S20 [Bacteroidia bacterium]MCZ2277680.1 30S ribosomal protein S20 [Bacteroidia bacterium]
MANHISAERRIRNSEAKNERNRYQAKTMRNVLKKVRSTKSKEEANKLFPELTAMLDKLAKKNVIHKNKAANLKASITRHIKSL